MKASRNYVILGLVVLLGGAGMLLWRQFLATEELKARVLAAEKESAQHRAGREAQKPIDPPQKETAIAPESAEPKPAGQQHSSLGDAFRQILEDGIKADAEKLKLWLADANDPAVMRRLNTQARNQTLRRYGALFSQLNLPADQTEALTKLLIDKRQAAMDIIVSSLQQGDDPTAHMDALRNQVLASKAEIENQVHALMGDANYAQYQAYDQNFSHATVLNNLQTALAGGAEPLTPEQAARMTQLLEQTNSGHVTPEVVAGANEFLSPTQMQALQDLRAIFLSAAQKRLQPGQALPTESAAIDGKP